MSVRDLGIIVDVISVQDHVDGKRVNVEVEPLFEFAEREPGAVMDEAARAKAAVAAGFAKEGFFRSLELGIGSPKLERRTDIVSKTEVKDGVWNYDIIVRSGFVLQ